MDKATLLKSMWMAVALVVLTSASGAPDETDGIPQDESEAVDESQYPAEIEEDQYSEDSQAAEEEADTESLPEAEPAGSEGDPEASELGSYLDFTDDFDDICFSDSSTDFIFRD